MEHETAPTISMFLVGGAARINCLCMRCTMTIEMSLNAVTVG